MAAQATTSAIAVPEDLQIEPARLAIGRQIGVGASAIVYDATYTFHDRAQPVVFKRFNQEMLRDPTDLGAITREVTMMHEVDLDQNVLSLLGVVADPRAVDQNGAKIGIGLMLERRRKGRPTMCSDALHRCRGQRAWVSSSTQHGECWRSTTTSLRFCTGT